MQEKYKVIEIFERDYGCEERAEGQTDMVQVRLCSESGKERVIETEDAALYREEITEGTEVFLIDGKLKRALGSDWVEQCNQKRDAQGFIKLMDRLRAGETAVCPFCGGVVSMTASEDGKDIFSCNSCDMYFSSDCKVR